MSEIRVVWQHPEKDPEPSFPATDQHPDAERFFVWADGSITKAVKESVYEAMMIDELAQRSSDLSEKAGSAMRRAEALKLNCEMGTLAVAELELGVKKLSAELVVIPESVDDVMAEMIAERAISSRQELDAATEVHEIAKRERDHLEAQASEAMDNAKRLVAQHGEVSGFEMDDAQRKFLARIQIPVVRQAFIDCSRKARRAIMEEREKPVMVVDAIGEPTMDEIRKLVPDADATPTL